jgi:tRNA A-37 threonylcarbamoyl transferase component Bud32
VCLLSVLKNRATGSSGTEGARFDPAVRLGRLSWVIRSGTLTPELRGVLEDPDRHLCGETGRFRPVRKNPATHVAVVGGYFLKRYNRDRPGRLVKSFFRLVPAQRAFDMALRLEQAGIDTPQVLAVAHRRAWGMLLGSYLITEYRPEAVTAFRWEGNHRRAARSLAGFVARLHDAGFFHRDLHLANLMMESAGNPLLIDLDGMRYLGRLSERKARWELARFSRNALKARHISRSTRGHFLAEYCRLRRLGSWRDWWKRIERGPGFF